MIKKTPNALDTKITVKYNHWIHVISDFLEHCHFLVSLEEEEEQIQTDIPVPKVDKKSFKEYIIECKSFEGLYLSEGEGVDRVRAAKSQADPRESEVVKICKYPVDNKKVFKGKMSRASMIVECILFNFKKDYMGAILAHAGLFPARYGIVPGTSSRENLICILTVGMLMLVRV